MPCGLAGGAVASTFALLESVTTGDFLLLLLICLLIVAALIFIVRR